MKSVEIDNQQNKLLVINQLEIKELHGIINSRNKLPICRAIETISRIKPYFEITNLKNDLIVPARKS